MAVPVGEGAKAVEIGDILTVDAMQGQQLIQLHKAVAWEGDHSQLTTPEQALPPSEKRKGHK